MFVVQAANEETKEHLYESLLAECRDTIQAVREELKSEAVRFRRSAQRGVRKIFELIFVFAETARPEL